MNQSFIVGRIVNDPKLHEMEDGTKVTYITVAVPRSYKNSQGEYPTDFIECSLRQAVAENTVAYCNKGDLVGLKGSIHSKENKNENGKRNELIFVADRVSFLSSKEKIKENSNEMDLV